MGVLSEVNHDLTGCYGVFFDGQSYAYLRIVRVSVAAVENCRVRAVGNDGLALQFERAEVADGIVCCIHIGEFNIFNHCCTIVLQAAECGVACDGTVVNAQLAVGKYADTAGLGSGGANQRLTEGKGMTVQVDFDVLDLPGAQAIGFNTDVETALGILQELDDSLFSFAASLAVCIAVNRGISDCIIDGLVLGGNAANGHFHNVLANLDAIGAITIICGDVTVSTEVFRYCFREGTAGNITDRCLCSFTIVCDTLDLSCRDIDFRNAIVDGTILGLLNLRKSYQHLTDSNSCITNIQDSINICCIRILIRLIEDRILVTVLDLCFTSQCQFAQIANGSINEFTAVNNYIGQCQLAIVVDNATNILTFTRNNAVLDLEFAVCKDADTIRNSTGRADSFVESKGITVQVNYDVLSLEGAQGESFNTNIKAIVYISNQLNCSGCECCYVFFAVKFFFCCLQSKRDGCVLLSIHLNFVGSDLNGIFSFAVHTGGNVTISDHIGRNCFGEDTAGNITDRSLCSFTVIINLTECTSRDIDFRNACINSASLSLFHIAQLHLYIADHDVSRCDIQLSIDVLSIRVIVGLVGDGCLSSVYNGGCTGQSQITAVVDGVDDTGISGHIHISQGQGTIVGHCDTDGIVVYCDITILDFQFAECKHTEAIGLE